MAKIKIVDLKKDRTMKKNFLKLIAALFCIYSIGSQAVPISASLQTFPTSGKASVFFDVSGLGDHSAPSLGAFDFNFTFDPNLMTLDQVVFGGGLGSPDVTIFKNTGGVVAPDQTGSGEALTDASFVSSDEINVNAVSLLETDSATCIFCIEPFLDDLQPDSFGLVNLIFDSTELDSVKRFFKDKQSGIVQVNGLSDAFGNNLPATVDFFPAPEPPVLWVFLLGLLMMLKSQGLPKEVELRDNGDKLCILTK